MLRSLTARQFLRWAQYAELEPFGEVRADLRSGLLISQVNNAWFKGRKIKPDDVFESLKDRRPWTDADNLAMQSRFRAWTLAAGGTIGDEDGGTENREAVDPVESGDQRLPDRPGQD